MIMKIDNSSYPFPSPGDEGKSRAIVANPADNAPATVSSSTSVSITNYAKISGLGTGVANTSVSASKVIEIKQAITEGRFQINASAVADSLIKSVNDLIASQQA
jgi:negative regulator of flagellin synthesis FlgM